MVTQDGPLIKSLLVSWRLEKPAGIGWSCANTFEYGWMLVACLAAMSGSSLPTMPLWLGIHAIVTCNSRCWYSSWRICFAEGWSLGLLRRRRVVMSDRESVNWCTTSFPRKLGNNLPVVPYKNRKISVTRVKRRSKNAVEIALDVKIKAPSNYFSIVCFIALSLILDGYFSFQPLNKSGNKVSFFFFAPAFSYFFSIAEVILYQYREFLNWIKLILFPCNHFIPLGRWYNVLSFYSHCCAE